MGRVGRPKRTTPGARATLDVHGVQRHRGKRKGEDQEADRQSLHVRQPTPRASFRSRLPGIQAALPRRTHLGKASSALTLTEIFCELFFFSFLPKKLLSALEIR